MKSISETISVILERMLGYVTAERDKREGAVIYDSIKPAAEEIANMQLEADEVNTQSKVITATEDDLEDHVADMDIERLAATKGKVIIVAFSTYESSTSNVTMELTAGAELSTIDLDTNYSFVVGAKVTDSKYTADYLNCYYAECQTAGALVGLDGDELQQTTTINGLAFAKIITIANPGTDEETDEDLRARYIDASTYEGFGGNRPQYIKVITENEILRSMEHFQLYTGAGGRVVISALGVNYSPFVSNELSGFMNILDPQAYAGTGAGEVPIGHRVIVCSPTDFTISIVITGAIPKDGWTQATATASFIEKLLALVANLQDEWAKHNNYYQYSNNALALSDVLTLMLDYMTGTLTVNGTVVESTSGDMSFGTFVVPGTETDQRIENAAIITAPVNASKFPRCTESNISIMWAT